MRQSIPRSTNSFLLTGTSEEDKAFVNEVVEVKATEEVEIR